MEVRLRRWPDRLRLELHSDHGKPLTIQIAPVISGYRVVEAKTFANDEPTAAQMRVLREFIAHFRGGLMAGGARCGCKARPSLGEADHTTPP